MSSSIGCRVKAYPGPGELNSGSRGGLTPHGEKARIPKLESVERRWLNSRQRGIGSPVEEAFQTVVDRSEMALALLRLVRYS